MSDIFGEARIRIVPDLSGFSERLSAELNAATQLAAGQQRVAGASTAAARGAKSLADQSKSTTRELLGASSASARLDSALLGLRTAAGSTAVIGLGAMSLAAIVAGKALRGMLVATAEFEQELSTFQATTGATAEQMEAVSDAARRLGADIKLPAVSAADAAVAMTELAKAGLTVQDAIAGSEGVLQLATAAQISNAQAAQIAANSLNAFGLAGDQAVRVADVLANASNAAQGSIVDFGQALAQSEAVARQVGLSLEDTTAILSLFAKNGLQGSDAGTSLRVALIRLVAPTEKAAAEIRKLGLNIRDAQGNLRADVFAQFGEATRDLTPAARDAAAALIFGQDAIRAVSIGAREGTAGLRLMRFEMDQSGTAAELAGARTQGLAGAMESLKSSLETIGINIGPLLAGPLEEFAKSLGTLAGEIGAVTGKLHDLGQIKIPPISIDVGFEVHLPGGRLGSILSKALGLGGLAAVTPLGAAAVFGKQLFDAFKDAPEAARKLKVLQDQLQDYQKARVAAEKGGQTAIADRLTARINKTKQQIDALKVSVQGSTVATQQIQDLTRAIEILQGTPGNNDALITALRRQIPVVQETARENDRLIRGMDGVTLSANNAAGGVDTLTRSLGNLGRQSATTQAELLKVQSEGGSPQAQIGLLQSDIVTQRQIIEEQKKRGGAPGSATAIRKAREQIIADQGQIDSLQSGIASDAKAAADKAKAAATQAQKHRDEQFKALAELFGGRQQNIEDAIARAGIAGNLAKEIRLNQALIASLQKEKRTLLARLKTLKVSADVRKQLMEAINRAIEQAQQDALRLTKDLADKQQAVTDARQAHLEAVLSIAETTTSKADDRRALNAIIAFDKAQIARIKAIRKKRKLTLEEAAQLDAYRVDLAQRNQALKELGNEAQKGNQAAQAAFEFLQAQQGFAANLLGNLVPLGSLGNTVGGGTSATSGTRQVAGGFEQPRGGEITFSSAGGSSIDLGAGVRQQAAVKAAQAQGGFTASQSSTVVELLRMMVEELRALRGGNAHPEARYHRVARVADHKTGGV